MPQNFKTRPVNLNQAQYELIETFPVYEGDEGRNAFLTNEYHVVDITLQTGVVLKGLLVMNGDTLLVPESEPDFLPEEIVAIAAANPDDHPDFTITDVGALWDGKWIEWSNGWRLDLFGPVEAPKDWRSATKEEAHAEALNVNDHVETYSDEIAPGYGPYDIALTQGGIRMTHTRARDNEVETITLRPKDAELWVHLLNQYFAIDPSFTLGEMIELLDLPPEVDREVYQRTMRYSTRSFRRWVDAVREEGYSRDSDIEYIEVGAYADERKGAYSFFFGASGISHPLKEDDPSNGLKKGDRINYSLSCGGPARLRHVPLRYNAELILPVSNEEMAAYYRGPLRAWRAGGEVGPKPEMPIRLKTQRRITLREFIGALFTELSYHNWRYEDEGDA